MNSNIPNHPSNPLAASRRRELQYSAVGYQMVLYVLAFTGLGYWVDQKWNWAPIGLITGVILGCISAVWSVLRIGLDSVDTPDPSKTTDCDPEQVKTP